MVRLLSIIFIPLAWFYAVRLVHLIGGIDFSNSLHLNFLLGFILSAVFVRLFLRKISFFTTFEHELTHNIWAVLTLNRPEGFHVDKYSGGEFIYQGRRNFIISLSPYFFQTINLFLFIIILFIQAKFYPLFITLIGITAGYHLNSDISEISPNQPDLRVYGLFFSFVVIILGNILMYGLILSFVINRWAGMWQYLQSGPADMFNHIIHLIK